MQYTATAHPERSQALDAPVILAFDQISRDHFPLVGGKGANLGALTTAGFPIPTGFCVTTIAFDQFMASQATAVYALLDTIGPGDVDSVRVIGEQVREQLHTAPIPPSVADAVFQAWQALGTQHAYAVRSSATAEDLPDASFAGQQDTYLNIRGFEALLESVRRCWASLFTDRAILYRMRQGFDHREVRLSVVVQQMVQSHVSGIMFTAEPVSGKRQTITIDASYGLGEALVAGLVSADLYHVDGLTRRIIKRQIADKQIQIRSLPAGGVEQIPVADSERRHAALTDQQVLELAALGTRIEQHYATPQDIEWALVDGQFVILQARPITSLYPLPQPIPTDDSLHVYMSFNHVQVMTDAMPELSISLWKLIFPFGRVADSSFNPLVLNAGGRVFIDVSPLLRHPIFKRVFPLGVANADHMAAQAMRQLSTRPEFLAHGPVVKTHRLARWIVPLLGRVVALLFWRKPEGVAAEKTALIDQHAATLRTKLDALPTPAARLNSMIDTLYNAFQQAVWSWAPYPLVGMISYVLLGKLGRRLLPGHDLSAITRGLSGNVTTEMDLAVGDLADLLRDAPRLFAHLRRRDQPASALLASADAVPDGRQFMEAWTRFITRYGMRGPSEIDPSRLRWAEEPSSLLQMVLGNAQHPESGTHRRHHRQMAAQGDAMVAQVETAAGHGLLGVIRRPVVRRLVRVARNLVPLREHPKFLLIHLIWQLKQTVLECGAVLVAQGRLDTIGDVWFLTLPELQAALHGTGAIAEIAERKAMFQRYQKLQPPRVMTSTGEIPTVNLANAQAPVGALVGSPVSAGVIEGIAHVIRDPQTEMLNPGEILVAPFTDPGWTPLFINAGGLVMEVGGLMTHGSVIAREYGIPAVVGVPEATTRIKTGQRLRVHGDSGYVEIIEDDTAGAG